MLLLATTNCCDVVHAAPVLQFPGGPPRVLEDLKDRYYSIARKLMVPREGTDATLLNQHLLRNPYNAKQCMPIPARAVVCCRVAAIQHSCFDTVLQTWE